MPEKDPSFWAWFSAWLYHSMPTIYAMLLAVVIAALRVMYGGGTKRKMLLEGALCGSLSLGAVSAMKWFGVPEDAAAFIGSTIGFVGVEKLREYAFNIFDRRLGSGSN